MNIFSKKGLLAFSATNAILFYCLFGISSGAIADNIMYDFNVSYSNIYEKGPNAGDKFSDIHINAKAQFARVTSDSDFSDPEHGFEDTRMLLNLSDSTLVGGPYPTSHNFSELSSLFLKTSYTVEDYRDDEVDIDRRAQITFVDKSPRNDAPFYQLGNVQIVRNLTEPQYNNLRQMLLDEDPLSFVNQFLSMNPFITAFYTYRYDNLPGGWSAWWTGTQSSFSLTPLPQSNTPPVADAGADISGYTLEVTCVTANGADKDNDEITYTWSSDTVDIIETTIPGQACFNTEVPGEYTLKLVAFDGTDYSEPDDVTVTITHRDTDGDGLLDVWETDGVDVDNDGIVDLDLPAMGADPNHKDIFVEIDYMVFDRSQMDHGNYGIPTIYAHTHKPKKDALQLVIDAFKKAPVKNPDGTNGINLHIDTGPDSIMNPITEEKWGDRSLSDALIHETYLGTCSWPSALEPEPNQDDPETCPSRSYPEYDFSAFDRIKSDHFKPERFGIFHYNVWGHHLCPDLGTVSGISRGIPASDFIVTLGGYSGIMPKKAVGSVIEQAGTFMHELGHNLSLRHGGADNVEYKPNYLSVMNYSFQLYGIRLFEKDGYIDYSRFQLPTLNEANLHEADGLSGVKGTNYLGTRYYNPEEKIIDHINTAIDWNSNTIFTDTILGLDINKDCEITELKSETDWDKLVYNGGQIGEFGKDIILPEVISDPSLVDIDLDEALEQTREIAVSVDGPYAIYFAPSLSFTVTYTIVNRGMFEESYDIEMKSKLGWADLSMVPDSISVAPDESVAFDVPITIPNTASPELSDAVTVNVYSTSNPLIMDSAETQIVVSSPDSKEECKGEGWQEFGFKNQGQCVKYVNHNM